MRTRSRHGADLDGVRGPRQGPRAYLAGVWAEMRLLDRPGAGELVRLCVATVAVCGALCAYLAGCDRLVGALVSAIF